jgi:hypothetical protein
MRRRLLVITALVLAIGAGVFLVHDVLLFDGDRFVREWGEALNRQGGAPVRGEEPVSIDETEFAGRARWHAGEQPCFTYAPPPLRPEAVAAIADEMVAAGVLEQVRATFSVWTLWAALDERERHGEVRDEEALAFFAGAGRRMRLLIALNRAKVIAAAQRAARASEAEAKQQLTAIQSQLAPEDVRVGHAFWRAHRLALPAHALFRLRPEIDRRAKKIRR